MFLRIFSLICIFQGLMSQESSLSSVMGSSVTSNVPIQSSSLGSTGSPSLTTSSSSVSTSGSPLATPIQSSSLGSTGSPSPTTSSSSVSTSGTPSATSIQSSSLGSTGSTTPITSSSSVSTSSTPTATTLSSGLTTGTPSNTPAIITTTLTTPVTSSASTPSNAAGSTPSSATSTTTLSTVPTSVTMPTVISTAIPNITDTNHNMVIKFNNEVWIAEYGDKTSEKFITKSKEIEETLKKQLANLTLTDVKVTNLSKGSLIATTTMTFKNTVASNSVVNSVNGINGTSVVGIIIPTTTSTLATATTSTSTTISNSSVSSTSSTTPINPTATTSESSPSPNITASSGSTTSTYTPSTSQSTSATTITTTAIKLSMVHNLQVRFSQEIWYPEYLNQNSERFKNKSDEIRKSLQTTLLNCISVLVNSLSEGSIIANTTLNFNVSVSADSVINNINSINGTTVLGVTTLEPTTSSIISTTSSSSGTWSQVHKMYIRFLEIAWDNEYSKKYSEKFNTTATMMANLIKTLLTSYNVTTVEIIRMSEGSVIGESTMVFDAPVNSNDVRKTLSDSPKLSVIDSLPGKKLETYAAVLIAIVCAIALFGIIIIIIVVVTHHRKQWGYHKYPAESGLPAENYSYANPSSTYH